MSFSRLLLVAANSKKYIPGKGNDKVCISSIEGEVILCFQLDDQEKRVARSLGMPEAIKRCDGLVFYSQDGKTDRVICLVEMKSTNVEGADEQLISTKKYITELLLKECNLWWTHLSRQEE